MKHIKSLLIFDVILLLSLALIDSVYATAWDKAQTSKSGIVDMMEVLPEYLQVDSTAENRDFHIKRNERAIGSGTQYYFYFEGGTLTVSMTTDGILRIGTSTTIKSTQIAIGTSTFQGVLNAVGSATFSGTVTAGFFSGDGAGLTGVTADLGAVSGKLSVGTQSVGITSGQIAFGTTGTGLSSSSNLYWNNTNNSLGIGTNTPSSSYMLQVTDSADLGVVVGSSGSVTAKTITATGSITVSNNGTMTVGFLSVGTVSASAAGHGTITVRFLDNLFVNGTITAGTRFVGDGSLLSGITATGSTTVSTLTTTGSATVTGIVLIGTNTPNLASALYVGSSTTGNLGTITAGFLSIGTISANAGLHGTTTIRFLNNIFADGTVTASSFSGNGAGLTGISVAFSTVTGSATASQIPLLSSVLGSTTASQIPLLSSVLGSATSNQLPISPTFIGTQSTFGTTTQHNSSIMTIYGSTSPLSIVTIGNGTNTTAIMTSDTAPSPNLTTSSGVVADGAAWKAFDRAITTTRWVTGLPPCWITYNYGTNTTYAVKSYSLTVETTNQAPKTFTLQGSNDNINFTGIDYRSSETVWTQSVYNTYSIATSTTAYQFYRLYITDVNGSPSNTEIYEMKLLEVDTAVLTRLYITDTGAVLIGTTTANSTTTAYKLQVAGSVLATSLGVTCYESIKSIIGSGSNIIEEGYNAVMGTKLFKHHPKIRDDITIAHAEEIVKSEYVSSFTKVDYETFKTDRLGSYTTYKDGSSTVNWTRFNNDFQTQYVEPRKDEFYVLPDKNKRVKDKKVEMESDMSITNITPVSDHASTPDLFKRHDKKILDLEPQIGCLMSTAQYQDVEIKELRDLVGSLTSRINKAGIQ